METITVTVNDRAADARAWGSGRGGPILRTVTIPAVCPTCGGPRGEPRTERYHEDGDWYSVSRWTNPCGHVDMYADVLREAAALAQ